MNRISFLFSAIVFVAAAASPLKAQADGQFTPTTATGFTTVGEDFNQSTLKALSAARLPDAGKLQAFMNTTPFSAAHGWTYQTAPAASSLQKNLKVNDYFAWVVNSPDVVSPLHPLVTTNADVVDSDGGGAVFDFTYTAGRLDPGPTHLHFLQIYSESLNGGAIGFHLDNGDEAAAPFYDPHGASDHDAHSLWFGDEPFDCESYPCSNTDSAVLFEDSSADLVFNSYLVGDSVDPVTGNHTVTLFGGYQWGYDYFNRDLGAPEPATWAILLLGFGLVGSRLRRRRAAAPAGRWDSHIAPVDDLVWLAA